ATQGRAFWVLDDLTPLHEYRDAVLTSKLLVFTPRPALRWTGFSTGEEAESGPQPAIGRNPPDGVVVFYWLAAQPADNEPLTVEFLDGDTVLRKFAVKVDDETEGRPSDVARLPAPKAGLNRVVWDMRIARPSLLPRAIIWGNSQGPEVSPGTYNVRFKLGS